MNLLRILILFLILSTFTYIFPVRKIDSRLSPYYQEFVQLSLDNCKISSKLNFPNFLYAGIKSLDYPMAGVCNRSLITWFIFIDKDFFNKYTEIQKKTMIFHELTHCILKLNHIDNPNHYMYPIIVDITEEELKNQVIENINTVCKI